MIFCLFYTLIMAGYAACGLLLGSYMREYTGASSLDLGFIFMIQPFCVFMRPFISAYADRYQSHKRLLTQCIIINSIGYTPFIIIPFLLQNEHFSQILTQQRLIWILAISHLIGSIGFCGTRTLGDALSVNFAKRIGSDFTYYRKFGSISFGTCGFLLGLINQDGILPDYVLFLVFNSICMAVLAILVYLWPDEYFLIVDSSKAKKDRQDIRKIPSSTEALSLIWKKLKRRLMFNFNDDTDKDVAAIGAQITVDSITAKSNHHFEPEVGKEAKRILSLKQQVGIFLLLLRRDIRIPLFLLFLFYGGLAAYAPQNFVYTYMMLSCDKRGDCDGSSLSGLTMLSYCVCETIVYLMINKFRGHLNHFLMLEITLISATFHYYFYGFFISHLSPYFFLIESLHGIEYGISLSMSCELGHKFASQVELLLPELRENGTIDQGTDEHLVKVSLMATMNGCFTLVYDGIGTILGAFIYGLIIQNTSYEFNFRVLGTLAVAGIVISTTMAGIGKCLGIRPQIKKLQPV